MKWYDEALSACVEKLNVTSDRIGGNFPHWALDCANYDTQEGENGWVAGFWPGILWMMYKHTGLDKYKEYALECERKLDEPIKNFSYELSHDIGFMWLLASKPPYVLFNDEKSRDRLIFIANLFAGRFNIKGNYIRAWQYCSKEYYEVNPSKNVNGWAIIDCAMNIPLLFIVSEMTGDPRYAHIGRAHADTIVKHFLREDGSVNHICEFDAETGEFVKVYGGQGYSDKSAWARGASWCIHGLALAYGYTKDKKYLDGAKKAADFFYSSLPEDKVPYWDFRLPEFDGQPRDTSAAACAASGMLEIAKHLEGEEKARYTIMGETMLKALWEKHFIADSSKDPLLNGATVHYPAGYGVDCSVIYADFYFLEGLLKLTDEEEIYNW